MEQSGILVVDDDKEIAELVEIHLAGDGYRVYKAYSALEGFEILEKQKDIQLIILDVMMPGMDGLTMCKKIRDAGMYENSSLSTIPIIILSAKSADLDKIIGLGAGADDYVIKPFNPLELMARVKSQLRRYTKLNRDVDKGKTDTEINLTHLTINKETHSVWAYEKEARLTPIEFDILYLLASNPGKVFSTDEIFERVWNEKMYESNNTVMVHIRRIREKLEMDSSDSQIIKTVWGVGYKIEK